MTVIDGIRNTQEVLNFCAEHRIESNVEVIPIPQVNKRVLISEVRVRFVINLSSLR